MLFTGDALLASDCEANYASTGSVLHGKTYSTFGDFPSVEPSVALRRMAVHLKDAGFEVQNADEAAGTISAAVKISSNRAATAAIKVEPLDGGGSRIRFSMSLPAGAMGTGETKAEICRNLELARVDPAAQYRNELVSFISSNAADQAKVSVVETDARRRTTKVLTGALIGAVAGGIHAKLTGGDMAREMAVGALAGGALTFAITKVEDKRLANRDEVVAAQRYDPSQGYRAGVREVTVSPSTVKPGEKVTIVTTYWVLTPTLGESFGVRRYAGIELSGTYLRGFRFNPEPFQFGEGGGEYQTTIELGVPQKTPPGSYSVHWVVDGQSTGGDASSTFTVAG
jgi:outer membrane lipoprotein SlyB